MNYFSLGDELNQSNLNSLVYLLRKFKRLRTSIKLGEKNITTEYGTFRFIGDFTNINGNYTLEEQVNVYANDVFKNAQYEFIFNVINIDTSEEINRRIIYKSGDTGDEGILNITLPEDMLNENEVIIPEVIVNVFFNTHEYQNGLNSFKVSLNVDHRYLTSGTNKITVTILEQDNTPVSDIYTTIYINGIPYQVLTDSNGKAEYTYQYTGKNGKVEVRSNGKTAVFFDGGINFLYERFTSKTEVPPDYFAYKYEMKLGYNSEYNNGEPWMKNNDVVKFSCEEDGYQIFLDNPKSTRIFKGSIVSPVQLTGTHWSIVGDVTAIGADMFDSCHGLTEIYIPKGIEKIGKRAFYYATGLKSIEIPETVYILGDSCFFGSGIEEIKLPSSINSIGTSAFDRTKIKKYELAWTGNQIIPFNQNRFPIIDETVFNIPLGETANYIAKNYPAERLVEAANYELTLEIATPIISLGDSVSATATLTVDEEPAVDEEIGYVIKHNSTIISEGTATTNSVGQATISYTGTGVGDVEIIASYNDLEESVLIEDYYFYDPLTEDKSRYTVISGTPSLSYGENGLTVDSNVSQVGLVRNNALTLPNDYEAEITITYAPSSQYGGGIAFDDWLYDAGAAGVAYTFRLSDTATKISPAIRKMTTGDIFKVIKQGTTMKLYINDVLLVTNTISNDTHYQHFRTYLNRTTTYKDLKIKAL